MAGSDQVLSLVGLDILYKLHLHVIRDATLRMELWACGFNAWNQLHFEGVLSDEPEDVFTFKRVLTSKRGIRIIETSFSACLGMYVNTPATLFQRVELNVYR